MVDALFECVLEAAAHHRAVPADLARLVDADAVTREERGGGVEAAVAVGHPGGLGVGVVRRDGQLGRAAVQLRDRLRAESGGTFVVGLAWSA